jgi:hypothetical protein
MPAALTRRLCRFNLLDNTRGEPDFWEPSDVRRAELTWQVGAVDDAALTLELTGSALLSTNADPKKAVRGYDVSLRGRLKYDRAKKVITELEILAVGDHWGQSAHTQPSRPGRQPLGVVFELVSGKSRAERIPPQAVRGGEAYYDAR